MVPLLVSRGGVWRGRAGRHLAVGFYLIALQEVSLPAVGLEPANFLKRSGRAEEKANTDNLRYVVLLELPWHNKPEEPALGRDCE